MPDLTVETAFRCSTGEHWETQVQGSKGAVYTVRWSRDHHLNQTDVQFDFSCTCKAYKYGHGGYCKHINLVSTHRCGWDSFHDAGEPTINPDGTYACPDCGSEAKVYQYGA